MGEGFVEEVAWHFAHNGLRRHLDSGFGMEERPSFRVATGAPGVRSVTKIRSRTPASRSRSLMLARRAIKEWAAVRSFADGRLLMPSFHGDERSVQVRNGRALGCGRLGEP